VHLNNLLFANRMHLRFVCVDLRMSLKVKFTIKQAIKAQR